MYQAILKPFGDKLLALFLLVLFSPLMIIGGLLIYFKMGSPVFFKQPRPGLCGEIFEIIKFRTMDDLRDKDGELLPDDKRLYGLGKQIRRFSLDELPQLFNVLKGEMSFVGPRPLLVEYLPLYNDEQKKRHNVKPGITGWAQVNGRNAISWEQKFKYDVWYVNNQSFFLDMKILWLTFYKVLQRKDISSHTSVTMEKFKGNYMSKKIYGIYGASGFGKEIMPLLHNQLQKDVEAYFIDDAEEIKDLNGHQVLTLNEFLLIDSDEYYVSIAIANSHIREKLTEKCLQKGIKIFDIKAENIVQLDAVKIGEGAILCPFVTLTSNITIGKSFHANIYSYVAHDCVIGDYVTFAPAVKCNGNIRIEDHVYIGTGVIIKQGRPDKPLIIGEGAVIGAGAVVTKSVPAGMTVFGNPAIELTKENLKRRK